jgi:hypothetical protein
MIRFLVLFFLFHAVSASAATIETKHFSLSLPAGFKSSRLEQYKTRDEGKIVASVSQKQFLIIEYANKEKWPSGDSGFQRTIEEANKESEIKNGLKHYFEGKELESQKCEENCRAYYREATLEDETAFVSLYQYFVKGQNTWVFIGYVDAINDHATSQTTMQDFIEQIKARGL